MASDKKSEPLEALEARIGHVFARRPLLVEALTHMSAAKEGRGPHYQRLEFLGDRVLGIVVATRLFETWPDANEGELSKRFSEIVRKETCADVAIAWGCVSHIVFGHGIGRTAARANKSILGDVCESIIGAVHVDGGFEAASRVVEAGFGDLVTARRAIPRDPKTALQEYLQGRGEPPPHYRLLGRSGPEHAPIFRVGAAIEGMETIAGEGSSKRAAEQDAARQVLSALGLWKDDDDE